MEQWRAVEGWPYEVSDLGRVRRCELTSRASLSMKQVTELQQLRAKGVRMRILAEMFNVTISTVHRYVHRRYREPGRILADFAHQRGYRLVGLTNGKRHRQFLVHRLVMEAFAGPCPEGQEVNHRDGDKTNNRRTNLEYVTPYLNHHHAARHKLNKRGAAGRFISFSSSPRETRDS